MDYVLRTKIKGLRYRCTVIISVLNVVSFNEFKQISFFCIAIFERKNGNSGLIGIFSTISRLKIWITFNACNFKIAVQGIFLFKKFQKKDIIKNSTIESCLQYCSFQSGRGSNWRPVWIRPCPRYWVSIILCPGCDFSANKIRNHENFQQEIWQLTSPHPFTLIWYPTSHMQRYVLRIDG